MRSVHDALNTVWRTRGFPAYLLWPLGFLYCAFMRVRRYAYLRGWLSVHRFDTPVIVVGNLSVGGTGKTPTVIAIAECLKSEGWSPGIVSRGYGGTSGGLPRSVAPGSPADGVGDEPVLLARRTRCPVVVAPDRPGAVRKLLAENDCDVVISDDGLQHLALHRDVEIAMVGGERIDGNGFCLPAGPLREPASRLESVDFVVRREGRGSGYGCTLEGGSAVKLIDHDATRSLEAFRGITVHAVAGVGKPDRFFRHLRNTGLDVIEHPFPDHHGFSAADLNFGDEAPVFMTEKDAVKCENFADERMWFVPVRARIQGTFYRDLLRRLNDL